jgi:hypothetical protein
VLDYDLTAHKISVTGPDGRVLFAAQPLPDNPGGFDLHDPDRSIAVHNPGSVDFVGVYDDSYDGNKEFYG